MTTYDSTDRGAYMALGAMFGIAAGIGAGMLLAPRSGEETRRRLQTQAEAAKAKARDQLTATRDKAATKLSESLDKSKELTDVVADTTKQAIDKTNTRAKDAIATAQAESSSRQRPS